jgi:predicted outer membrane repeat protein
MTDINPTDRPDGGIDNVGALAIIDSTISHNKAAGTGGGIYSNNRVTIIDSTVSSNTAGYFSGVGGGINNVGTLTVSNSTISANSAGYDGGGINNAGTLTVSNSTIAANSASYHGGGIDNKYDNSILKMRNSIVAGNTHDDLAGPLTSGDHNLIGGYPLLGPLQDNGGPTQTMALLPGSPAIDAGDNIGAPLWDQRGPRFPRIEHGTIDLGAFEYHFPPDRQPLPDPVSVETLGLAGPPTSSGDALPPTYGQPFAPQPVPQIPAGPVDEAPPSAASAPVATPRRAANDPAPLGLDDLSLRIDWLP